MLVRIPILTVNFVMKDEVKTVAELAIDGLHRTLDVGPRSVFKDL